MSKRLAMLEQLTNSGKADSFTWYALALEYKSGGRVEDALATFAKLRDHDPGYVPMYLMAGSLLIDEGREDEARAWLRDGMERASKKGDTHARDEMDELIQAIAP